MGKSVSTPPVPDYMALAKQQGQENLKAGEASSRLSNPNMITPFGTQTITYGAPTFDESGYNRAVQEYQARPAIDRSQFYQTGGGSGDSGTDYSYFDQAAYDKALKDRGAAPERNAFMTGVGAPTVTQTLNPTAQSTLEAQQRVQQRLAELGEQAMGNVQQTLSTQFVPTSTEIKKEFADYGRAMNEVPLTTQLDMSNLAAMPINAGTTAQDLILQRLAPTIESGDTSFKQALANQGLAPGTEAYNAAFRNREMSKNDLYNQAALQGINLDMAARQQGVNELLGVGGFQNQAQLQRAGLYNQALGQDYSQAIQRAQFGNQAQQQQLAQDLALRSQPLQELAAIMGGSQIQLPQFSGYTPVQVGAAPTFNAAQAQYQGQLGQANAQNAANSQMMSGLFGLGAAGLMAPAGTFGFLKP